MITLYFIIIFFIIIFNILIPIIIERLKLEKNIFESEKGQSLTELKCFDNKVMILERTIFGLRLHYYLDQAGKFVKCDETIPEVVKKKECGIDGEYNNRTHPCSVLLSELLFYKNY